MPQFAPNLDLATLDGTNGFILGGASADDFFGFSVSSAGDVNGDGFDDLIIGAYRADPNGSLSGASYVLFGKATGFDALIDVSALDGSNGFKISGVAAGDTSGHSVSDAGDINGDGFADLIIGAYRASPNGSFSGASYVVFGKASGFGANLDLSSLDGTNGFRIDGLAAGDSGGRCVSSAGDVNGDGFDDIIIAAPGADPNGISSSGASYVVFGKASGFGASFDLSTLDGTNGFRISGVAINDLSGWSLGSGDVNGDGFADLILSAEGADPNGDLSGATYVVFGKAAGFSATLNLSALDGINGFKISGAALKDYSGYSVASAGDVNGDGFADVVIGAIGVDSGGTYSGAAYLVFGKAMGFSANLDLSALDGSNGFRIDGAAPGDLVGRSVSSAGDVNGDGFDDVLIGALFADASGNQSGAAFVVFGKATGFDSEIDLSAIDGNNGFKISGVSTLDYAGHSVSAAGDVNGDGFDDLLIGARNADPNGIVTGASYVVFGHRALESVTIIGTARSLTHNGGTGDDTITALDGNDIVRGWEGDDALYGGAGQDEIDGGMGSNFIDGGSGSDSIRVNDGDNTITGGSGSDIIITGNGDNTVSGDDGEDSVACGSGNDVIRTGSGNDVIKASFGSDNIDGGSGFDRLDFSSITGKQFIDLNLASGLLSMANGSAIQRVLGIEHVIGSKSGDHLAGNAAANVINGGNGKDALDGGGGDDQLIGGKGKDMLTGGLGADQFNYLALNESRVKLSRCDVITDFTVDAATGPKFIDRIDFSVIDAIATTAGIDDAFTFIGSAKFTAEGQISAFQSGFDTIIKLNTTGLIGSEMTLLLKDFTAANLTGTDFIL
jgi:Ca2+-binding RTX toxin-like protein